MNILKFGGSSVADAERIRRVVSIVQQSDNCRAVVFSAFGGVTDLLIGIGKRAEKGDESYIRLLEALEKRHIEIIRELISVPGQSNLIANVKMMLNDLDDVFQGIHLVREMTPRMLDFIMSFGERLSCLIISRAITEAGTQCEFLDAREVIRTDARFGNAQVRMDETRELLGKYFADHPAMQIITGFTGSTENGLTTTLGRGGSDYTASILGAALEATEIRIWTDVSGVMTADPRKVRKAFPVPTVTYEEAQEMSHFGAKVIYPPTMQPAMAANIPIRIKNTFEPDAPGTLITSEKETSPLPIKGISSISNVALLRVEGPGLVGVLGVAERIFGTMARGGINTILISQASSEHSVCFAVEPQHAQLAKHLISETFAYEIAAGKVAEIIVEENMCVVAVVGERMRQTPGIAGKIFQALGRNGVNISAIAQGSSELNISMVIPRSEEQKALIAIHDAFFLSGEKTLNLFFIGPGLIGGTVIDMLLKQRAALSKNMKVDLRVIGMCNSRKMWFDLNGLDTENWRDLLDTKGGEADLDGFLQNVYRLNLPNAVVVDCTSSDLVADKYEEVLSKSISIVTPNKKACSGPLSVYRKLQETARRKSAAFFYETNAGAGLPVIKTLQEMHHTGDEITRVEGVFSGTLSYLLNEFDGSKPFSQLVIEAREKGYTEPDPRDDLNGMDVARKLLILARESGFDLELEDIDLKPLLPESCFTDEPVDVFLKKLPEIDAQFKKQQDDAAKKGHRLRYLAKVTDEGAHVGMESVGPDHPAYNLQGTDNLFTIFSVCYNDRPMAIAGPGAGPAVTASGVMADIIKVAGW